MKKINKQKDVKSLIDEFSIYMPRLFQKISDIDEYVEKLVKYANIYVACNEEENIGFVIFYSNDQVNYTGFVSLIVVKDSFKGTGMGRKLIKTACDVMIENNMKNVGLVVDKCNDNAIGFYKHLGFTISKDEADEFYMEKQLP